MSVSEELLILVSKLDEYKDKDFQEINNLQKAANEVEQAWSGSWLGYQSSVYYNGFSLPPAGNHFSMEWGFESCFGQGTIGNWREYTFDEVIKYINDKAGNPNTDYIFAESKKACELIDEIKASVRSLLYSHDEIEIDEFIEEVLKEIKSHKVITEEDCISYQRPKGQLMSRDMTAIGKGFVVPPHIAVLAKTYAVMSPFSICSDLRKEISQLSKHIRILEGKDTNRMSIDEEKKTKDNSVFIVHGHDELAKTQCESFLQQIGYSPIILHKEASQGRTIIEKIEHYSNVGFGIVLYTPCDIGGKSEENAKLQYRARQNVVLEHGFLMGKIGRSNVVALVKGEIEKPNDISGVVYQDMDDQGAWKFKVSQEMKAAGYEVDMNKIK